ncbi:uncharacterized protein B0T15DRAFT_403463, partial [Chaetomium strumarium]
MNRSQSSPLKRVWLSTLTETMPLTPLDYTAPQNYIVRLFGFHFPNYRELDRIATVAYLKDHLAHTISLMPFLGGQIIHTEAEQLPRMVYSKMGTSCNLAQFPGEVFDSQNIDISYPHLPQPFWELLRLG